MQYFSYILAYLTLKYERNWIFHPFYEIYNLSDFLQTGALKTF